MKMKNHLFAASFALAVMGLSGAPAVTSPVSLLIPEAVAGEEYFFISLCME